MGPKHKMWIGEPGPRCRFCILRTTKRYLYYTKKVSRYRAKYWCQTWFDWTHVSRCPNPGREKEKRWPMRNYLLSAEWALKDWRGMRRRGQKERERVPCYIWTSWPEVPWQCQPSQDYVRFSFFWNNRFWNLLVISIMQNIRPVSVALWPSQTIHQQLFPPKIDHIGGQII